MLEDLITSDQLQSLAGTAAFKRGEAYFREGRAELMVAETDRLAGTVEGSEAEPYRARMEAVGDELRWDCTCPVGDRGEFCKHLVALALAWLGSGDETLLMRPAGVDVKVEKKNKRRGKEEEIGAFLAGQDQARLVEWLLEAARDDRATRERLLLAARAGGPASEFRKLITDVTRAGDFVDYHHMPNFARRVHGMIDALEGLDGVELMGLAEYAVERLHKALEACDDSDGYMSELLGRLVALHARAGAQAKPDPVDFARWLFARQMGDEWGTWPGPEAYIEVLRKAGMVEYARLAWKEWDMLPARKPGDSDRGADRYRITGIMESLAKLSGDPEALVEVIEKDLSSPYAFLRIAEIHRDAGNSDAALEWAEQGLAAFPENPDWRLQDFLVDAYLGRGRQDEAMAIAWNQFVRGAGLEGYKKLLQRAWRTAEPERWRGLALDSLREAAVNHHGHFRPMFGPRPERPDFTTLVRALLWENEVSAEANAGVASVKPAQSGGRSHKDLDAALAEAKAGLCHAYTLIDLAHALAPARTEEAVSLYRRAVNPIVELRKNDAYADAAKAMRAARDLLKALGREREFGNWLAEVRLAHKPKRNFMKLLDGL